VCTDVHGALRDTARDLLKEMRDRNRFEEQINRTRVKSMRDRNRVEEESDRTRVRSMLHV
jgi:hypothetical protein